MQNIVAHELKPIDEQILDRLTEGRGEGRPWGRNTPSNLAGELDVSRQWVTQRLQMMESADIVENIGGGVYAVVDDPRNDVDHAEESEELAECRAKLEQCRDRLETLEAEHDADSGDSVDVTRLRSLVEELEASLERGEKQAAQNALRRLRNTLE